MSNNKSNGGGIGFFGMLAIVFIACKITGFIDWSWWLVLLPIWGPLLLVLVVAFIAFIVSEIK
ncbi:hypothetical protein [Ellagibacter isourolithinifaciens]|uniref:hypothetical protein n=1 Tax=Ellagibacter isourolithinifaciens TaxID=2137581 RepID=UPI003AB02E88